MRKQKIDFLLGLTCFGIMSVGIFDTAVAADDPGACATAKVISGEACKDLKIKFDLSQCKGGGSADAQVKCGSGIGSASADNGGGSYTVDIKETWGGTWAISGAVKFASSGSAAATAGTPAVAGAAPAAGPATPSGATTTFSGVARLRYDDNFAKATTGALHTNYTSLRIRPNLNIKVNPDVSVIVEPQYTKTFGAVAWVPSAAAVNTPTETVGNAAYTGDPITMNQAYLELKMDYGLSLQAGRMALRYGDQFILGSADWADNGRSFDALKFRYTQDKSYIDVIISKVIENNKTTNAPATGDDKDMNGIYASWFVNDNLKTLDAYYLYQYDQRSAASVPGADTSTNPRPSSFFGVQGLRFVTAFDNVGWKAELAQNLGSDGTSFIATGQKDKNDMLDTEVSYNVNDSMKTRVALQYFKGGQNWIEFYPTTAKQLGIVDVVGRRNLSGFGLHYTATFSERYAMDADYYSFKRTSTDATAYSLGGAIGTTAASTSDDVGQEIDLVGRFMASKSLTWSLGINIFQPGANIKDIQNATTADSGGRVSHYGYIMADVKF
ncbi:MAG: alginate export family protein [Bdellovibrionota bacterium]